MMKTKLMVTGLNGHHGHHAPRNVQVVSKQENEDVTIQNRQKVERHVKVKLKKKPVVTKNLANQVLIIV